MERIAYVRGDQHARAGDCDGDWRVAHETALSVGVCAGVRLGRARRSRGLAPPRWILHQGRGPRAQILLYGRVERNHCADPAADSMEGSAVKPEDCRVEARTL